MLHANFNAYNNYITDSLYQWDINQDLVISGLGLSVAPEIHFANANMDRAIVRQSTIDNDVITVKIPNSLLQEALIIKAYIGVYEEDTFKVVESIEIPVMARKRPLDYIIQDTDEEIYSFNKLETLIDNMIEENERFIEETNAIINDKIDEKIDNEFEGAIDTLKVEVTEEVIAELGAPKTKKYIFIGDSYGTGMNNVGTTTTPWITHLVGYLGLATDDYYSSAVNGSGFVNGTTFLQQLQSLEIADKNEITDIVIGGGYNDYSKTEEAIIEAISEFMTYAETEYPNATVRLGCIGWNQAYYPVCFNIGHTVLGAYKRISEFGGVYLNNVEYAMHNYENFVADGFHPDENGQIEIARAMSQAILSGSANVNHAMKKYDGISAGMGTLATGEIYTALHNEIGTLYFWDYININGLDKVTLNHQTWYDFLLLPKESGFVHGCGAPNITCFSTNILFTTTGEAKLLPAVIRLNSSQTDGITRLQFRLMGLNSSTVTGVTGFYVMPQTFTVDALFC